MEKQWSGSEQTERLLPLMPLLYPVTVGKSLYFLLSESAIGKGRQLDAYPSFMS